MGNVHCSECGSALPPNAPGGYCPRCLLATILDTPADSAEAIDCGDHDLLAGILALQLNLVSPEEFLAATDKCTVIPYLQLTQRLLELEAISESEQQLIKRLSEELVCHYGGDLSQTLNRIGTATGLSGLGDTFDDPPPPERIIAAIFRARQNAAEHIQRDVLPELPGRYTNAREMSRGGMGKVYVVHDDILLREVVLKELVPVPLEPGSSGRTPMSPDELAARFLREARLTGQLEHPSIVPVYELGERANGTPYYTMKFVRGRTLANILKQAKSLNERLRYLSHYLDLCQAVAYAHSRKVIHRDLKPSNIMIGEFGETVVIDWGLAKVVGEYEPSDTSVPEVPHRNFDPRRTARGFLIGTPHYMAPEQAAGRVEDIDQRTDVFALGVVLFELLTGEVPFRGESPDAVLKRAQSPLPADHAIPREAPPELASICRRAMAHRQQDRYPSARELADDVQRFMTGAMVQAYQYTPLRMLAHAYRRNRLWLNAAALAVLAVLTFGAIAYYNIREARNDALAARDLAELNRVQAEYAKREALEAQDIAEQARFEAEFRQYGATIRLASDNIEHGKISEARAALESAPTAFRGWEWGFLANKAWPNTNSIDEVEIPPVAEMHDAADYWRNATPQLGASFRAASADITGLRFLPGREHVASKSLDGSARIWNFRTGEEVLEILGDDPYYGALVISPDQRYAARSNGATAVGLYNASTGDLIRELRSHTEIALPIEFSPDGTLLATVGYDQRFVLWKVPEGEIAAELHGDPAFWATGRMGRFFGQFQIHGNRFITLHNGTTVRIWDQNGSVADEFTFAVPGGYALESLSPDGSVGLLASFESGVAIGLSINTGDVLWRVQAPPIPDSVSYRFSPDGTLLAARTKNDRILLFALADTPDAATGFFNPVSVIPQVSTFKHYDPVAFDSTGRLLAVPERDGTVRVFVPARTSRTGPETLLPHPDTVLHARFEPNSNFVATACFDGVLRRWDIETGRVLSELPVHEGPIINMIPSFDRTLWSTRGDDGFRALVDIANQQVLFKMQVADASQPAGGARGPLLRVGASQSPRTVLTRDKDLWLFAGEPGVLRAIDVDSGETIHLLPEHEELVYRPEFTPDESRILAHGYRQSLMKVWDAKSGQLLQELHGPAQILHSAISPDSRLAAVAYMNGVVNIWDLNDHSSSPDPLKIIADHRGTVYNVEFNPSGTLLATASGDAHVKIWSTEDWKLVSDLDTHKNIVLLVRFSPDGQRVLTGSNDNLIHVFDLAGRELLLLPVNGTFATAEWSPDGRRILATTVEGVVQVWTATGNSIP